MSDKDIAYFSRRAEQEYKAARRAVHPSAVLAHIILADHYVDAIHSMTVAPEPDARRRFFDVYSGDRP